MKKFVQIIAGLDEFKIQSPKGFDYNRMMKTFGNGRDAFQFILRQDAQSNLRDFARLIQLKYDLNKVKVFVVDEEDNQIGIKVHKVKSDIESLTANGKQYRSRQPKKEPEID